MSTKYSERVMLYRADMRVRRKAADHRSYVVERLRSPGLWLFVSGPWDYYGSAKSDMYERAECK